MKVRKGVFGAVLLLCATLCMTNVTALADDGTHTHPICGTTHTDIGDHTGECADVVWTAWDGTSDIDYGDDNTAYVYLSGNAARSEQLPVKDGKTLYLCLNGYSITRTTDRQTLLMRSSAFMVTHNSYCVTVKAAARSLTRPTCTEGV